MNTLRSIHGSHGHHKTRLPLTFLFLSFFFLATFNTNAQGPGCPNVDAGADVVLDCGSGGCTDLTATFLETGESTSYDVSSIAYEPPFPFTGLSNPVSVGADDIFSPVIPLPFDFCYFGDTYNEVVIGSNGIISFDVSQAEQFCSFSIGAGETVPTTAFHQNSIMMFHDIDPRWGTAEVGYEVLGEAPCRTLVVAFANVPYYNFNDPNNTAISTFQMVLYETTNAIDFYLQTKPDPNTVLTSPINDGRAVLGIQNSTGTQGFTPPDRNTSVWAAVDEAWRFTPNGDSNIEFAWKDSNGAVIGNTPTINVCPTDTEVYTAEVIYTNCNGDIVTVEDDVEVSISGSGNQTVDLGEDLVLCDLNSYEIIPELTGDFTGATYLWSPNGETTPTITVSTSDTYGVEITTTACTISDDVTLQFLTSPNCTVEPICVAVDFEENFGTGTGLECDLMGATTTYLCWDGVGQLDDGEYILSNTADGLNDGWHPGMEDHTEGDVDGRALFVNADLAVGEFYRRTITLSENIDYTFNAWITTVYDTDAGICGGTGIPSNVIFRIEDPGGTLIEETNTGDIENGPEPNWQEFFIAFNTGSNTAIQLVLINNSIGGCGNDLAIDDITLSLENSEPQIVTPDDLTACDETGNEEATFDLESQIPTILDGQDPADFNVTFHLDQLDAEANQNAIATPGAYVNTANPETVFVRVERAAEVTCFSTVNFDLTVGLVVDFEVDLPSVVDLCSTDEFPTFDATPTNQGLDLTLVTYEWTDGGGNVVSTEATYTPTAAGTYSVTISLPPCSFETIAIEVNVTDTPVLDLGADQVLCDGGIFEILPEVTGNTDGITYLWSTGETTPTITVDTSGTYTLEVTVGACIVSDSIEIFISEPIIVEIGDDFKTCPDQTQVLTATSSETDVTYQWFLNGDIITGATDQVLEFSIEVGTMGTQTYSVLVNKGECVGEDEIDILLYDVGNCVISQGISPNGDEWNQSLDLEFLSDRAGGIRQLQIYNRYGALVFEAVNYIKEWEGQDKNGNELPTGTYFYVIDLAEEDSVYGLQATGWIYLNKDAN